MSEISTFGLQNPEEIIQNERTIKYKLIELQNMAIYWDTDVTLVGDLPSRDLEVGIFCMLYLIISERPEAAAIQHIHNYSRHL